MLLKVNAHNFTEGMAGHPDYCYLFQEEQDSAFTSHGCSGTRTVEDAGAAGQNYKFAFSPGFGINNLLRSKEVLAAQVYSWLETTTTGIFNGLSLGQFTGGGDNWQLGEYWYNGQWRTMFRKDTAADSITDDLGNGPALGTTGISYKPLTQQATVRRLFGTSSQVLLAPDTSGNDANIALRFCKSGQATNIGVMFCDAEAMRAKWPNAATAELLQSMFGFCVTSHASVNPITFPDVSPAMLAANAPIEPFWINGVTLLPRIAGAFSDISMTATVTLVDSRTGEPAFLGSSDQYTISYTSGDLGSQTLPIYITQLLGSTANGSEWELPFEEDGVTPIPLEHIRFDLWVRPVYTFASGGASQQFTSLVRSHSFTMDDMASSSRRGRSVVRSAVRPTVSPTIQRTVG